jgi:hypothetical protein
MDESSYNSVDVSMTKTVTLPNQAYFGDKTVDNALFCEVCVQFNELDLNLSYNELMFSRILNV